MCDHTWKLSHISLSQGKIFSFYSKLGHFYSHVVPKNKDFSGKCSFDYLDIKVLKNWQAPKNDSQEIKCLQQVILDCTNSKLSKIDGFMPI